MVGRRFKINPDVRPHIPDGLLPKKQKQRSNHTTSKKSRIVVGGWVFLHFVFVFGHFWIFDTMLSRPTKQPIYWCIWQEVPSSLKMKKKSLPKEVRREGYKRNNLKKEKYFMPDDPKHDAHGKIQLFCR